MTEVPNAGLAGRSGERDGHAGSDLRLPQVPREELLLDFHQGMLDRMAVSFHKYGPVGDAYPSKVSAVGKLADPKAEIRSLDDLGSLGVRLRKYQETGNIEWLIDGGNFLGIEHDHPAHPAAHFEATSAKQSPGRVWNPDEFDGSVEISARANDGTAQ